MNIRPFRVINRRKTKVIKVGKVNVGGESPISVQSMTNTITKDVKLAIQQARCNLKMSQKQLAAALSIPTDTITKYENGKAVPNNALLNRMQRILKVKLTGKDIGQSIPDKK